MDQGDIATVVAIMDRIRDLAEGLDDPLGFSDDKRARNPARPAAFRGFLQAMATKEVGAKLARALARLRGDDAQLAEAIRRYLVCCGKAAFSLASELLGATRHDAQILSALEQACERDLSEIRIHVTDPNAKMAVAALRLVLDLAGEDGVGEYGRALGHKDAAVRREALRALSRCSRGAQVIDGLVDVIDDPAPDVRAAALRALPQAPLDRPRPDLYQRIAKRVEERGFFEERPAAEQDALVALLVKLDPGQGYAFIEKLIEARSILHRAETHRRRLRAISALGLVAAPRSEEILGRITLSAKTEEIRAACRAALRRLHSPPVVGEGSERMVPGEGSRRSLPGDMSESGRIRQDRR
jgi:hypothetical protein